MIKGTAPNGSLIADGQGGFTLIGDIDPAGDACSSATSQVLMTGKNEVGVTYDFGITQYSLF